MLEGQSLQYACLASLGTCAKGVQFYCPSRTYPATPYNYMIQNKIHNITDVNLHICLLRSIVQVLSNQNIIHTIRSRTCLHMIFSPSQNIERFYIINDTGSGDNDIPPARKSVYKTQRSDAL